MVIPGLKLKTKYLIIISGPTAVGKTSVAIDVAKHFGSEIISADSRQFYKGLVIGTAAPTKEQLTSVKHHFIGHLNLDEYFNVSKYEQSVLRELDIMFKNNPIAVMTGGSGFYIQAVTDGIDQLPDADNIIRDKLTNLYKEDGVEALRKVLVELDPNYAAVVDLANPVRMMRAIEVTMQTGIPYSAQLNNTKAERNFSTIKIALNVPREVLHQRINSRVDQMIEDGLIDEARKFYHLKSLNSLNTVGYKELFEHFDGIITLDEAIGKIKTNTRRYARRQITWLKRDKEYHWLPPNSNEVIAYIEDQIK